MVLANRVVAEAFCKLDVPFVYRIHGEPSKLRVQEVEYGVCGAWVYCAKCKAKTNYMNTRKTLLNQGSVSTPLTPESRANGIKKAVEAWNRRAGEEDKHETD